MRFLDRVTVKVRGGDGGAGSVHWRREIYVPRGGPDGGNGGSGGAVVFVADPGLHTLIDFSFQPMIAAVDGEAGSGNQCDGKAGEDLYCPVPVGTQVLFGDRMVADLKSPGSRWVAARGGRGGMGNRFFRSASNPAPDYAQKGELGDQFEFTLELKSVADVGLVGLPNVGKSTLISKLSRAHPLIADYPFTTLVPNLGVVEAESGRRFVVADIPGLIPDAHKGKGLGIQFLQHVERTSVLVHLIDMTQGQTGNLSGENTPKEELMETAVEQFKVIDRELGAFSEELRRLPRIVVFSKCDNPVCRSAFEVSRETIARESGVRSVLAISSISGEGLPELTAELDELVSSVRGQPKPDPL